MNKIYHLIDMQSSNVEGSYDSVEAALDDLSEAVRQHGIEAAEGYGLLLIEGEKQTAYAQPEELVKLVEKHMHAISR
jgi:hypothetical protein